MKVNLKTLSELSGFSPATVSNALHNKRGVSKETAARVLKLAREFGYRPKSDIKSIKLVTYSDSGEVFSDSPFFSVLMESIENESRKSGYETTIFNLYRREPDYEQKLQQLLADTSSAILLLGTELNEEDARSFLQARAPLVLLDCWFDHVDFDAVLMENEDSVARAVDYLYQQGHRQIGYLQGSVRIQNFIRRGRGYKRGLTRNGLKFEGRYVLQLRPSIAGAYQAMNTILQTGRILPTAFIADNDMIALGAMQALQKNGWRIPQDISIIGFDDISFCQVFLPHLTTVKVFKKELGQTAVQELIRMILDPDKVKTKIELRNELIKRGSVSAPPHQRRALQSAAQTKKTSTGLEGRLAETEG